MFKQTTPAKNIYLCIFFPTTKKQNGGFALRNVCYLCYYKDRRDAALLGMSVTNATVVASNSTLGRQLISLPRSGNKKQIAIHYPMFRKSLQRQ